MLFSSEDPTLFVVTTALMLLLQCGFLMFESGAVREKNAYNTAMKNFTDFLVGVTAYLLVTALIRDREMLMKGGDIEPGVLTGALFCTTALTISSGAVAERFLLRPYLLLTLASGLVIYPLIEHICWASGGFLREFGYIDRAGAGVVHVSGGVAAAVAAAWVGPRLGRFPAREDGAEPLRAHLFLPSNLVTTFTGCFLLMVGMLGFNVASLRPEDPGIAHAVVVSVAGGLGGGLAALCQSLLRGGPGGVLRVVVGALAGLVSVTACFPFLSLASGVLTGVCGAAAQMLVSALLRRVRIDDALDAVSAHAGAGLISLLSVAFFGPGVFSVQALSAVCIAVVSGGLTACVLWLLSRFMALRPPPDAEEQGLNLVEHQAPSLADELCSSIEQRKKNPLNSPPARVEPYTSTGRVAARYNELLAELESELRGRAQEAQVNHASILSLASILHDLRSPLQCLAGEAYLLRRESVVEGQSSLQGLLLAVEQQTELMTGMLREGLDLVKSRQTVRLDEGCQLLELLALLQSTFKSAGVLGARGEVEVDLVFSGQSSFLLAMSLTEAFRVFCNLIENARSAAQQAKMTRVRVSCVFSSSSSELCCTITDSGPGIDAVIVPHLFEPFLSGRRNGTGLGLAASRELVRAKNGDLTLVSERPASFSLRIPHLAAERFHLSKTRAPVRKL